MKSTRLALLTIAAAAGLATGCHRSESDNASVAKRELSPAGRAELSRIEAKEKRSGRLPADGVSVSTVELSVNRDDKVIEVRGQIRNGAVEPVHGATLAVTFKNADGTAIGGYEAQQFFSPALDPGTQQSIFLRAPLIGGLMEGADSAVVKVRHVFKPGESPDGWRPLEPTAATTHEGAKDAVL